LQSSAFNELVLTCPTWYYFRTTGAGSE